MCSDLCDGEGESGGGWEEAGWKRRERDGENERSRRVRRWMDELPGVQEPVDDDRRLPKVKLALA